MGDIVGATSGQPWWRRLWWVITCYPCLSCHTTHPGECHFCSDITRACGCPGRLPNRWVLGCGHTPRCSERVS